MRSQGNEKSNQDGSYHSSFIQRLSDACIKSSHYSERDRDYLCISPQGNELMKNITLILLIIFLINAIGCSTYIPPYQLDTPKAQKETQARYFKSADLAKESLCNGLYKTKTDRKACKNPISDDTVTVKVEMQ